MSKDYSLSMSGSRIRIPESMIAVELYLELGDWDEVRARIDNENLFQLNSESSRKRVSAELLKRLRTLTQPELEFLSRSNGDDRCAMFWIAVCRTYQFVRDLSEQVLVERYRRTIPNLTQAGFDVFYDEQCAIHPELARVTEAGRKKLRNQVFLMLRECKLLDEENTITPIYLSPLLKSALGPERASDLGLFPGRF